MANTSTGKQAIVQAIILITARLRSYPRAFRSLERGRKVLFVPFLALAVGFVWLLYRVAFIAFDYLVSQGEVGRTVLDYGLATVLTSFFFLLITSTAVTASSTLFRNPETHWLFTRPLHALTVFLYKSAETLLYSTWALLFLTLPIFLALFNVYDASILVMFTGFTGLILLVTFAAGLGIALAFLVTRLVTISALVPKLVFVILAIAGSWWLYSRPLSSSGFLPDISSFQAIEAYLAGLRSSSPLLPGSWMSSALLSALRGNWTETGYWLAMLSVSLLFVWQILLLAAHRFYLRLWWRANNNLGALHRQTKARMLNWPVFPRTLSLFEKDSKLFLRDPGQWMQTAMILGIFVVFLLVLRQVPRRFSGLEALYGPMLAYLTFAALGYFFTVFALRFVLPAMSLEGQNFWMLLSGPLQRRQLLRIKLVPLLLVLLGAAAWFSGYLGKLLTLPPEVVGLISTATLSAVTLVTVFTFAVGVLTINLRERDPSKLSSSIGAILTTMIIFGYLLIVILALSVPLDRFFKAGLRGETADLGLFLWVQAGLAVSAVVFGMFLWLLAERRFDRKDF